MCPHRTPVGPCSPPAPEAPEPTPPTSRLWLRAAYLLASGDMGIAGPDRQATARAVVGATPELLIAIGAEELVGGVWLNHCR